MMKRDKMFESKVKTYMRAKISSDDALSFFSELKAIVEDVE